MMHQGMWIILVYLAAIWLAFKFFTTILRVARDTAEIKTLLQRIVSSKSNEPEG
jgi:hypothetical protein